MSTENEIIILLKKDGPKRLDELAKELGISNMAVLRHMEKLEATGVVERRTFKGKQGRPYFKFSIKEIGASQITNSDGKILLDLISFLSENGHEKILDNFLEWRYSQQIIEYRKQMSGEDSDQKFLTLVKLRYDDCYFPEYSVRDGIYEITEYNCPIFRIAQKDGYACELERKLFENTTGFDVEYTHRQVDGAYSCKFILRKKPFD
ncbi:hypothetical protein [Thermoplasma volcanium GSS1]|uniref:HTH marR-type domain-containing protein n=1 Tax=Thermoplasma volcanium (strain ATCC 51530 / DSM 4299 / JCM 9571 / NBRC 15438 / GSS1) TaxID=273116 RepID=Q978G6_THEVO|nr:winged helix-turn-helix transcriptional regulator [Thermoplasma volcanium]BAB60591.1 hypothetical protein [Thermoplasma volcanium GSS1]